MVFPLVSRIQAADTGIISGTVSNAATRNLLTGARVEVVQLGRSARLWGQHVWLPKRGVAVLVNAFNFPAWGLLEKAACAWLAGMPVVGKPATATALVAERVTRCLVESKTLPEGVLSLLCGSAGDLLDHLGAQDVLAFTGSADTGYVLRSKERLLRRSVKVNVEADSLNSAVLAPDVGPGSETWNLFLRDVITDMTQKTGQKCTAIRRILVPQDRLEEVEGELKARLQQVVVGNPADEKVTMGPLATAQQLRQLMSPVELHHADRVVDHRARAVPDAHVPVQAHDRHHVQVEIRREAGVEAQLFPAIVKT